MTRSEYVKEEKNRLLCFCREHKNIYIYGAGKYGKRYFDVLRYHGFMIEGFITTNNELREYCDVSVYNVNDISKWITERDGIIPAYLGSSQEEIMKNFCHCTQPDVLAFDHRIILYMEYEIFFSPILTELKKGGYMDSIKKSDCSEWKNFLVIRLDAIGDVVCTTAFIRELKRNYPNGFVTVVVRKQNELLLKGCPYIDNLISYESELNEAGFIEECENFEKIKGKVSEFASRCFNGIQFDVVFLPREILCGRNRIEEFLMAFYSGADYRFGRLVDCDNYRAWVYDVVKDSFFRIFYQTVPTHETLYQLDMLKSLGYKVEDDKVELWPEYKAQYDAENLLKEKKIGIDDVLIAVGIVGSAPKRSWKPENYRNLFKLFHKEYVNKVKFIILGGRDAIAAANELQEDNEIVINLTGKTDIGVSMACIQRCIMYVGSNTGLLHIATALKKPSVTIYAELEDGSDWDGDSPTRYGARGIKNNIALIPPAGLDGCHGTCQKDYSHCINQITPFKVKQAMETILNENSMIGSGWIIREGE